jgi:formate dehydrogenase
VPTIEQYHGGQNTPPPEDIDFTPGELLGCVSGELGLREFVEGRGHNLIVTSDKQGPDSVLDRELRESGTPSPLRRIIPGGPCPTTA